MLSKLSDERKRELRLAGILFVINLVVIVASYSVYIFNFHYSPDTFSTTGVKLDPVQINLSNSRLTSYVFYLLIINLGISPQVAFLGLYQVMFSVVIAGITAWMTVVFYRIAPVQSKLTLSVINCASILLFVNPCFLEWYYFCEILLGDSFFVLLPFAAVFAWASDKRSLLKRTIFMFVFLFLALESYQVFIEPVAILCLLYSVLKFKFKFSKECIKEIAVLLGTMLLAGIIVITITVVLLKSGIAGSRSSVGSAGGILAYLPSVLADQKVVWGSLFGAMPKGVLIVFMLLLLVIFVVYQLKLERGKKELVRDVACTFICLVIMWFSIFFPDLVSSNGLAPRTIIGMFCFVFALVLCALFSVGYARADCRVVCGVIGAASLVMLGVFCVSNVYIQLDTLEQNKVEMAEIDALFEAIDNYEQTTGNEVTSIRYDYDKKALYKYRNIRHVYFDVNGRHLGKFWFTGLALKHFAPRDFDIAPMTPDERKEYIGGGKANKSADKNWDDFNPSEQILFDGNTCYYIVY